MRVGIEGRTLQGKRYGVARYLHNLLRNMTELDSGNEYIVYLSQPIAPTENSLSGLRYEVLSMHPSLFWRHLRLPLAMRRDGVDLHFSPSYFLPLIKVCPAVVVVHDLTIKVHPEWFSVDRRFRFDGLFWNEVKRAERIITVSEHSRGDILHYLGVDPSKVVVIPEAADELFRPVDSEEKLRMVRERYGLSEGFLFTVGAIHTRRNLERLIEAVSGAGKRLGSDLQLLIVGSPAPFSPPVDIEGTARRCGMAGRVVQVQFVSEEELLLLYNACALFAYPSLYEGFGLPVIEAMSCGAPVVCSNTTSLPEVGGDAPVYFDPTNVEDMTDAVARVLGDDALRERLSRAGVERASLFSWRRAAQQTLEVFKEAGR